MKRVVIGTLQIECGSFYSLSRRFGSIRVQCLGDYQRKYTAIEFECASDLWEDIGAELATYSLSGEVSVREECKFTKKDLDSAELYHVYPNRAPTENHVTETGMFDYSIVPTPENPAPWCWQIGDMRIRRRHLPPSHALINMTFLYDLIVHKAFWLEIQSLAGHALGVRPVLGLSSSEPLDWHLLVGRRVMPPVASSTTGLKLYPTQPRNYPVTVVVHDDAEGMWIHYSRRQLLEAFDGHLPAAAFTSELVSDWQGDTDPDYPPPQPMLIVGKEFRELALKHKNHRLKFEPVHLVDDPVA